MLERRATVGAADARAAEVAAVRAVTDLPAYQQATAVAGHVSVRGEFPTEGLLRSALHEGKSVFLPVLLSERRLAFHRWTGEPLAPGPFGIPIPSTSSPSIPVENLDFVLVPGVAFDLTGGRLGHGAGYYDRFLAQTPAFRLGLCWTWQIIDRVPTADHDEPVHALCTETEGIYRASTEGAFIHSTGRYTR